VKYHCSLHNHDADWPDSPCPVCAENATRLDLTEETPMTVNENEMEKRGVVVTEKEKTAHEQIKKQAGTVTGRIPTDKPNKANAPKKDE